MKTRIMQLAAVLLGLGLAWLLLELLLAVATPSTPAPPRTLDIHESSGKLFEFPHRRYEPGPRVNRPEFEILVAGDSFTWGGGVYHYDVFGERLEVLLERLERQIDFHVNLVSHPGWNTVHELRATRRAVRRKRPDLMLLAYCLNDAEPRDREQIRDIGRPLQRRAPSGWASRLLYRRSRLIRLLWERLESTRQRRAFDHYYHELYRRPGWEMALEALEGFRDLAREREIPFRVVIFPIFDQQLGPRYSYADLHALVASELESRGIRALDLLPAYRGIDARRLAAEPFTNPHPGELAHRIASQQLTHYLVSEGLVPIDPALLERVELSLPSGGG